MTFLAPWAAWFLAGLPVIVLLYLLKLKRRPIAVSTLLFWERVMQESRQRSLFQKLRQLLSLLLHLLIFLLIVAALAKPAFDRLVRDGASTIIVIDTRARMQAVEPGGETRFAKAIQEARRLVRNASPARQVALLSAGSSPRVITAFTGDERALLQGLEQLAVTDAGGRLETALELADGLLAGRKGAARIVLLGDGAPLAQRAPEQTPLTVLPCGSAGDNVAITRFATRPLLNSPQTSEVLLSVQNFGRAPVTANIELSFDGRLLDVRPITLAPGEVRLDVFPSVPRPSRSARGWLTAKLDLPDALAGDNVAYAVLAASKPQRVLLVSSGNWFFEKLLQADPQVNFEFIAPEAWQPEFGAKFDAVIFDNFRPANFDLLTAQGNFLFLKDSPFVTGEPIVEQPLVSDQDLAHPTLRLVSLQNITILRATAARLPKDEAGWSWKAPLRSFEHPLFIVGERPGQRVAALSFDVTESDLPLRVAFPLLIANTVHWLAGETPSELPGIVAGETLPLPAGATASSQPVIDPNAPVAAEPAASGFFSPARNGFYRLSQGGHESWLAVNTFSEAEANLQHETVAAEAAPTSASAGTVSHLGGWPLWQYLALAALLLFTLEWILFHRRQTE